MWFWGWFIAVGIAGAVLRRRTNFDTGSLSPNNLGVMLVLGLLSFVICLGIAIGFIADGDGPGAMGLFCALAAWTALLASMELARRSARATKDSLQGQVEAQMQTRGKSGSTTAADPGGPVVDRQASSTDAALNGWQPGPQARPASAHVQAAQSHSVTPVVIEDALPDLQSALGAAIIELQGQEPEFQAGSQATTAEHTEDHSDHASDQLHATTTPRKRRRRKSSRPTQQAPSIEGETAVFTVAGHAGADTRASSVDEDRPAVASHGSLRQAGPIQLGSTVSSVFSSPRPAGLQSAMAAVSAPTATSIYAAGGAQSSRYAYQPQMVLSRLGGGPEGAKLSSEALRPASQASGSGEKPGKTG